MTDKNLKQLKAEMVAAESAYAAAHSACLKAIDAADAARKVAIDAARDVREDAADAAHKAKCAYIEAIDARYRKAPETQERTNA